MKKVDGEAVEIVKGSVKELTHWIEMQALPITLRRGEFMVPLRTENQRRLFVAGLTLGAELTAECAQGAKPN